MPAPSTWRPPDWATDQPHEMQDGPSTQGEPGQKEVLRPQRKGWWGHQGKQRNPKMQVHGEGKPVSCPGQACPAQQCCLGKLDHVIKKGSPCHSPTVQP